MPPQITRKIERVNSALKKDIGELIISWLVDPRISRWTTVTRVHTTRDLGKATVYVAVLGDDQVRSETLAALESSRLALRHVLRARMRIRHVPEIVFKYDETIIKTADVLAILDAVAAELPESESAD